MVFLSEFEESLIKVKIQSPTGETNIFRKTVPPTKCKVSMASKDSFHRTWLSWMLDWNFPFTAETYIFSFRRRSAMDSPSWTKRRPMLLCLIPLQYLNQLSGHDTPSWTLDSGTLKAKMLESSSELSNVFKV